MSRLFISFSGGETSAFMAQWLLKNRASDYSEIVTIFANTGQENEETLQFVDQCDKHFGLNVVWVEAVINAEKGQGTTHRIVNFQTADRTGTKSFEPMIAKYGIPNPDMPHCTRELKLNAMTSYLRSIGWDKGTYEIAVGIRIDEVDRMQASAKKNGIIYPLIRDVPMTKPDINVFWRDMPFRLQLKGYQGNCKWCWKKSLRKHLTIIAESPDKFDFPERMEKEHARSGALAKASGKDQVFFRKRISTTDLRKIAARNQFMPSEDDSIVYGGKQYEMDISGACSESCEVVFEAATPQEGDHE